MTVSPFLYDPKSLILHTDLYQLTMASGYWKAGLVETEAVFHLFFRKRPFGGTYAVVAGLQAAITFIQNFRYGADDLAYLRTLVGSDGKSLFTEPFLEYLATMRLECDIDAVPEGSVAFPFEPILRVKGPLIMAQLLESPLLNLINFPTLIATKASRVVSAAGGDEVLEFGMRRAQGIDGALTASRSSYLGGCDATSNVLAGKLFGIPVKGTHAHSWVSVFDDEASAFDQWGDTNPNNAVFLIDTFDTIEGAKKAIATGRRLEARGHQFLGLRIDSGDLAHLSIKVRQLLDEAGFTYTKIIASNELDEVIIAEMKRQGARIDVWGVGTNLVTGKEQPALDGVYKLSAIRHAGGQWEPKIKLSEQMVKVSNPGILQVRRYFDNEEYVGDAIYDIRNDLSYGATVNDPFDATRFKRFASTLTWKDLLVPIFEKGKLVYACPTLQQSRQYAQSELARFPSRVKRFLNPQEYIVGLEQSLYAHKIALIRRVREREIS